MKFNLIVLTILFALSTSACSNEKHAENDSNSQNTTTKAFAKGADISWLTEMEATGTKFYNHKGQPTECLTLLKEMGVNAIRLRVWVDPTDGWNGSDDVLTKAIRAQQMGMRVMIDFHYSHTWADPGKQFIPQAWQNYNLEQMSQAVSKHTKEVLGALKNKGIAVEWVQVGNETATGMLWEIGRYTDKNKKNFAQLVNAGYDAAKSIYPQSIVIVHVDQGDKLDRFTWLFDGLKENGAKWDAIGMSLYPEDHNWEQLTHACLSNITLLSQRYNCPVVVAEVGMPWHSKHAESFMNTIVKGAKNINTCLGVFYWEPQCYGGWKGYNKGTFDNSGKPTNTLNIFKD